MLPDLEIWKQWFATIDSGQFCKKDRNPGSLWVLSSRLRQHKIESLSLSLASILFLKISLSISHTLFMSISLSLTLSLSLQLLLSLFPVTVMRIVYPNMFQRYVVFFHTKFFSFLIIFPMALQVKPEGSREGSGIASTVLGLNLGWQP